ncbi:response regulator transcription factor [Lysinibacillus endophyticus]|uniref:DNA-binding response regulator n=1 Tax=Ureibacillus endophyticus TaxID=1978490 RepID=A0A494Z2K3_9BACL|nr:response regulator transcription factor [Lysinibacillus endophyticus]MCP1145771.1 response regulator transcription factor [Lysinibacillus endophyticus]RKQ16755.1 DNA-binding response regulator [Lysinibacillus endophyticus]
MIKTIIVEDQELIRKSLKIVLESMSEIRIIGMASNGEEAIQLCEREKPDIVLMDIQMPVMDGVKATEIIKTQMPETKVIILTTFQDITYVMNALNAGAEGYILKAVDPQFLVDGIKMVYHGGSLIPQELAKEVFQSIHSSPVEQDSTVSSNPYELSQQELKVLKYLAQGLSNKAISERMFLSLGTVKNYISNIYSKLNVKNRSAAITKAIEESIIKEK